MFAAGDIFAFENFDRHAQLLDAPPQVFDSRRRGGVAHGDSRASGVEQAHRFVGQLPAGDIAIREPHGFDDRFVQDADAMMPLERVDQAAHHFDRGHFARLLDLHDLEPPGQGRVFLEILLVFGPSRGRDRAELAARQRRLEQIGGVALACLRRRRRSSCGLRR